MRKKFYKDKSFMIILLACLVAATAIAVGSVTINKNNDKKQNVVDLNEDDNNTSNKPVDSQVEKQKETKAVEESNDEISGKDNVSIDREASSNVASSLNFTSTSKLFWPIDGDSGNEVIMDFNIENTIYFATLNKYQTNPAILIQSEAGTPVLASAEGIVEDIREDEELGVSVVVSLGNGYELTYGQLKDVQVKKGQAIKAKDVIAQVSEPTKYYLVEGSNLYYMFTLNEEPIDPLDYLTY